MLFALHIRRCSRNFAPAGTSRHAVWPGHGLGGKTYWGLLLHCYYAENFSFCEIHVELKVELFWFKIILESKTEQTKVVLKCLKYPLCSHDWQTQTLTERDIDENICLFRLSTSLK